jgi:hypothetical protein
VAISFSLNGIEGETLQIEELERTPAHQPTAGDARVMVTVRTPVGDANYSRVWLSLPAMKSFAKQLPLVFETRKVAAKLQAMTPEEFVLEIHPLDSVGHIGARVHLKRRDNLRRFDLTTTLSGEFEINLVQFPVFLRDMRLLASPMI